MAMLSGCFDHPPQYRGLMERMARALGIDLESAVKDGHIRRDQIERLKLRCTYCDEPDACARLLSERPNMEAAPYYCVNSKTLAELAPKDTSSGNSKADNLCVAAGSEAVETRPGPIDPPEQMKHLVIPDAAQR